MPQILEDAMVDPAKGRFVPYTPGVCPYYYRHVIQIVVTTATLLVIADTSAKEVIFLLLLVCLLAGKLNKLLTNFMKFFGEVGRVASNILE